MRELEEDPGPLMEAAAVQAESHFKGRDLNDTWACVAVFAPAADTEGNFKADLFELFNADYRWFSRLMDRFLPDPRALAYGDRLARLTEIRAYARAQFLREDADVDWTEIGAKVKKLVDQRISAQVRQMMKPLSILDQDFEQKIAALPHDEARASVMEHAIRAQIHERLAETRFSTNVFQKGWPASSRTCATVLSRPPKRAAASLPCGMIFREWRTLPPN